MGFLLSLIASALFRAWRTLRGRDFCETCDGTRGTPGNEHVVRGVVMCDACHAKGGSPHG